MCQLSPPPPRKGNTIWHICSSKSALFTVTKGSSSLVKSVLKEIFTIGLGISIIFGICFVYLISLPIFLFRLILIKLAPQLKPEYGNILSPQGNVFSSDFFTGRSPRCSIIVPLVIEGEYSNEEILSVFNEMVELEEKDTGRKLYPEFKQYLEKWFDFPFWRDDENFDIRNHVQFHNFGETDGETESEEAIPVLIEKLLNKKFSPLKSPWEFHVVYNYTNPSLLLQEVPKKNEKCILLLFRVHHTLADGFAVIYALVEGLAKRKLSSIDLPKPNYVERGSLGKFFYSLTIPMRLLYDVSHYAVKGLRKNPYIVEDSQKSWKHLYGKGKSFPIEKIKEIKNELGVSFTSILLAAISASISRIIKSKKAKERGSGSKNGDNKDKEIIERASFFIPLPLPGHPNALRNHVTGAQIDLPMENFSDPTLRVSECERLLKQQKKSTIPMILIFVARTLGLLPSSICGMLTANRVNIGGLTSFPAGNKEIFIGDSGKRVLSVELACGALTGVSGVAFMAISYGKEMQFGVTAESAVLNRKDVDGLLTLLQDELELLHEIAVAKKADVIAPFF